MKVSDYIQHSSYNNLLQNDSSRDALKKFFCELCQKGYARPNELDSHYSSYEHNHRQRLKDMKQMQKDPQAVEKARKAEKRADGAGMMKIEEKGGKGGKGGVVKKSGGFKTVFKGNAKKEEADAKVEAKKEGLKPEHEPEAKKDEIKIPGLGLVQPHPEPGAGEDEEDYEPEIADITMDWTQDEKSWDDGEKDDAYDPFQPTHCGNDCTCVLSQARRKARAVGDEKNVWKYV
jgi:hypothetical protein